MNQENDFRKLWKVYGLVKRYMPKHPYHNPRHVRDVFHNVNKLSELEGICYGDRFVLGTAALLHDIIFKIGAKDNEERSAEFAKKYLPRLGYSTYQIQKVYGLILATKIPTHPQGKLEKIICDADVDNLGRQDFSEIGERVRKELGIKDDRTWYEMQLNLLKNHRYYTSSARKLRDYGFKQNIRKVEEILRRYEKC